MLRVDGFAGGNAERRYSPSAPRRQDFATCFAAYFANLGQLYTPESVRSDVENHITDSVMASKKKYLDDLVAEVKRGLDGLFSRSSVGGDGIDSSGSVEKSFVGPAPAESLSKTTAAASDHAGRPSLASALFADAPLTEFI